MPGPVILENDPITLRPADESDVPLLRENGNDPHVRATRHAHHPADEDWARRRLGGTAGTDDDSIVLLVCAAADPSDSSVSPVRIRGDTSRGTPNSATGLLPTNGVTATPPPPSAWSNTASPNSASIESPNPRSRRTRRRTES